MEVCCSGSLLLRWQGERKADKSQAKNAAATDPKLRAEILSEIDILADDDQKKKQKQQREQDGEDDNATSSLPTTVPGTPTVFETVEQANEFRKRHRIKIYGNDVPNPFATFEDLASAPYDLLPTLYNNVKQSKYATPTPIQMQSIPIMMKVSTTWCSASQYKQKLTVANSKGSGCDRVCTDWFG